VAPLPIAFFDLDRTLIDGYAYLRLLRLLWRRGVRRGGLLRLLGRLLLSRLTPRTPLSSWWPAAFARYLRGLSPQALSAIAQAAAQEVANEVRPRMREQLEAERRRGAEIWLVSATVDLLAPAVADALGFDRCLCTGLALRSGRYLGLLDGPICRGSEKLLRVTAELQAAGRSLDLTACSYYADGYEDLPLLEAVGRPCVVHPERRLWEVAQERGWPQIGEPRHHRAGG